MRYAFLHGALRAASSSWPAALAAKLGSAFALCFSAALALWGCTVPTAEPPAPPEISPAKSAAAAGMVDLRELVPDIALDLRYAGTDNFVGTSITGYEAARCYLRKPAAQALQRVETRLRAAHLRLQLYDCYRPARAVRHFVRWARDLEDQRTKARHYPNVDKQALLGEYIAPTSGHSRGDTLDLTLMQCDANDARCEPLDMGTAFDFFDPRAHTDAPGVTAAQRQNRLRLRAAMEREGFRNYPLEWWHYTWEQAQPGKPPGQSPGPPQSGPDALYDFPITPDATTDEWN